MAATVRLAIIDHGEPVVRLLAAIGNLNKLPDTSITPVLVTTGSAIPWFGREAEELVPVPGDTDAVGLIARLREAAVDAVWPGDTSPFGSLAAVVAAAADAAMLVVGPDAATISAFGEPAALIALGERAGIPVEPTAQAVRVFEVDTLTDGQGTTWALEPRELTLDPDGVSLLAESPTVAGADSLRTALRESATALVRASGLAGAATVRATLDAAGSLIVTALQPGGRPEHAAAEEMTGASFVGLQWRIAQGASLEPQPPVGDGYTIEARLLARDPGSGGRPTGGRVDLFSLPVGTGVRVDSSLREGDLVDATRDPVIATITAWGRDREHARSRLRAALERTSVALSDGPTNRTCLLALLATPEHASGPLPAHWLASRPDLTGDGPADPMALAAAAIEFYEADAELAQDRFRASAARGRPEHPEQIGAHVQLSYQGCGTALRVERIAADRYRVTDGDTGIELRREQLSANELRLRAAGRSVRVVALARGDTLHLEIDGVAHRVRRDDGHVVRSGWPALVAGLLVATGDQVSVGTPIAVLESMKMVTTVTSPVDGHVVSIDVLPNVQVDKGEPLMRIASERLARAAAGAGQAPTRLADLAGAADSPMPHLPNDLPTLFAALTNYLLGYDLDPATFRGLLTAYGQLAAHRPDGDPQLRELEDQLLDLFADVAALYRPRVEADPAADRDEQVVGNTQEYFVAFLQWLDPERAGLPHGYRRRLAAAVQRYGVASLADRTGLERATVWLFRALRRIPELAPIVTAILQRRLEDPLVPADSASRARLERLVTAGEGRMPIVADLARDVRYRVFDQPAIEQVVHETDAEMRGHLDALTLDPGRSDRADRINRLIWSPQPMRSLLLDAWRASLTAERPSESGRELRAAVLEIYLRRFYRIRDLRGLAVEVVGDLDIVFAHYTHDGMEVHVAATYLPLAQLAPASRDIAAHLARHAFQREAVLDLVTWQDAEWVEIDEQADLLAHRLQDCDFGRPVHRLDLTVTTLGAQRATRSRTQHVSFRPDATGALAEEPIYRNLHPMLAKRLDLWKLSNFELTRLPSPEDVYLFDGVAKQNPKDHRLFALAEVRDLTPVTDPSTGHIGYPLLGRMGLAALAAMRSALATYPARERPAANRLVLAIRPTWTIPATDWYPLARTYQGLARGAGLEKIVLHVSVPETDPVGKHLLRERILVLSGLGAAGLSIRMDEPRPSPVRPRTAYAQKVLTAARFATPYPYEIIRMLTPNPGDASPFPTGRFVELDLEADGQTLAPVDRDPGNNSAHIVVGLLTNYTTVHPEGITRVALLSDPTQGLGNLAEPECRRVNAALAYALTHRLPVEWYAVSSGALIAMDSGTENMDWIALTLRRIIEFTQAGGEINIIITGITVGGQPYWNAEATMLMHTKGILIMTPASAMVLTGKQALDFSGAVSADDNSGIGGYDRIMGPNGQAQYWAPSFPEACHILLRHYNYSYVVPGERFPRRRPTSDPLDRDVRTAPHTAGGGSSFTRVGEIFDAEANPERKLPFDMRSVMRAVADHDIEPLERWQAWQDADTAIVWDACVGGIPVCLIGLESRTVPRRGYVPSFGPPAWTSGTLFPQSSRKTARAINAASGNRPVVVLANLSGFDGSPESMRNWQLEYGAEIGRAVTNFEGPIVFVVVSRYHGGAFVVFSKALTESMEIAAVAGSFASVIGGAPAAATVFAREVKVRTEADPRVTSARARAARATGSDAVAARSALLDLSAVVRSEKLREVADEFDGVHTIDRALRMGSVDVIIPAEQLRPYVVAALERGMRRYASRGAPE